MPRRDSIHIEPDARTWARLIGESWSRVRRSPEILRAREELGLPTDRPVVMSGHQTLFWHPGILAKWYAMDAAARAVGGASAWIAVDHDTDDPAVIPYPSVVEGGVGRGVWRWDERFAPGIPPVMQAPRGEPSEAPADAAMPAAGQGLQRIRSAIVQHADAPSLAHQVMQASTSLVGGDVPRILYASELGSTFTMRVMLARMEQDPERCVDSYNRAAAQHSASGLRPLTADAVNDRWELPLWRIVATGARERVYAEDLRGQKMRIAPRAIMLTGLLRSHACDLFIHGLGGGIYDRACDDWFSAWMPGTALAATAVVSATLRLSFPGVPMMSAAEGVEARARAAWRMHHAMHNPGVVGDATGQRQKLAMVDTIAGSGRGGPERRRAYLAMHERIDAHRRVHASGLRALHDEVRLIERAVESGLQAGARDWPFALYPREQIAALQSEIEVAFAGPHA
ncbi:MAG TPA: hypothetical protein VK176_06555 [Phycisphaerales bacterium]|nr:hypothetical protein [Phycisphaerales bacterium]